MNLVRLVASLSQRERQVCQRVTSLSSLAYRESRVWTCVSFRSGGEQQVGYVVWVAVVAVGVRPKHIRPRVADGRPCSNDDAFQSHGLVPTNVSTDRYTFIQIAKKTHPKTLSSKNTFIQKHFHPKTEDRFHPRHFHPETVSSNDTFIQIWFRPTTLSSKTGFIQ